MLSIICKKTTWVLVKIPPISECPQVYEFIERKIRSQNSLYLFCSKSHVVLPFPVVFFQVWECVVSFDGHREGRTGTHVIMCPQLHSSGANTEDAGEKGVLREKVRNIDVMCKLRKLDLNVRNILPWIFSQWPQVIFFILQKWKFQCCFDNLAEPSNLIANQNSFPFSSKRLHQCVLTSLMKKSFESSEEALLTNTSNGSDLKRQTCEKSWHLINWINLLNDKCFTQKECINVASRWTHKAPVGMIFQKDNFNFERESLHGGGGGVIFLLRKNWTDWNSHL